MHSLEKYANSVRKTNSDEKNGFITRKEEDVKKMK